MMLAKDCGNQLQNKSHRHEISLTSEEMEDDSSSNDRTRSNDLRLQCHMCPRKFHKKIHLEKHLNIHDKSRPLKCDFCGKRFNLMWHLRRHQLIHDRTKPFACSQCDKSFCTKCELTRHVNYSHFGIKEYICEVCNRSFTLKSNLKVHQRKHTGEKPYKCNLCDQSFYQSGHLTYHLKKHSKENSSVDQEDKKIVHTGISNFRSNPRNYSFNDLNSQHKNCVDSSYFSNGNISNSVPTKIYSYYRAKPTQTNLFNYSTHSINSHSYKMSDEYLNRVRAHYSNYYRPSTLRKSPPLVENTNDNTIWRPFTEE